MAKVVHVGCDPFGLVEEPLCQGGIDLGQVLDDGRSEGEAKPGHRLLPSEAELVGDIVTGHTLAVAEGFFQSGPQCISQGQAQVWVADKFSNAIVHKALDEFFQLVRRELG